MSGLRGISVAEAMAGRHNNFGLLRLALALAVVVSHAFSVTTGRVEDEPWFRSSGFTLGEHAVNGFFAISGFLVTMSYDRRGWRDYVLARSLRIAPGLTRRRSQPPADLSYGVYLYGWPVQQASHALFSAVGAFALFWPALLVTLVVAMLSCVEKPGLALKRRLLRGS